MPLEITANNCRDLIIMVRANPNLCKAFDLLKESFDDVKIDINHNFSDTKKYLEKEYSPNGTFGQFMEDCHFWNL